MKYLKTYKIFENSDEEFDFNEFDDFAVKYCEKIKYKGWEFNNNSLEGSYSWTNKNNDYEIYATLFHQESAILPININDSDGDEIFLYVDNEQIIVDLEFPKNDKEKIKLLKWYTEKYMPKIIDSVEKRTENINLLESLIKIYGKNGELYIDKKFIIEINNSKYNTIKYVLKSDDYDKIYFGLSDLYDFEEVSEINICNTSINKLTNVIKKMYPYTDSEKDAEGMGFFDLKTNETRHNIEYWDFCVQFNNEEDIRNIMKKLKIINPTYVENIIYQYNMENKEIKGIIYYNMENNSYAWDFLENIRISVDKINVDDIDSYMEGKNMGFFELKNETKKQKFCVIIKTKEEYNKVCKILTDNGIDNDVWYLYIENKPIVIYFYSGKSSFTWNTISDHTTTPSIYENVIEIPIENLKSFFEGEKMGFFESKSTPKDYKYRGYKVCFNPEIGPGANGRWFVPDLHYFEFANKLKKGFYTVSKTQCQEAIDKYFNLNLKYRPNNNNI